MLKRISALLIVLVIISMAVPAFSGALGAVDPFTGSLQESWESYPNWTEIPADSPTIYLDDPTTIMGGNATISNPYMVIYEPNVADFWLSGDVIAGVDDGIKGMGLDNFEQTVFITFSTAVSSFGAYWAAPLEDSGLSKSVSVSFYDEYDNLIGSDVFNYDRTDGNLEWHGWGSLTPVKTIVYSGDYVCVDNLQANPVPEPSSLLALAGGLGVLGGMLRRRK